MVELLLQATLNYQAKIFTAIVRLCEQARLSIVVKKEETNENNGRLCGGVQNGSLWGPFLYNFGIFFILLSFAKL